MAPSTNNPTLEDRQSTHEAARRQLIIVCLLGTVVTFWGWSRSREQHDRELRSQFIIESERAAESLQDALDDIDLSLRSCAGLVSASRDVEHDEWQAFSSGIFGHMIRSGVTRIQIVAVGPDGLDAVFTHPPPTDSTDLTPVETTALVGAAHRSYQLRIPTFTTCLDATSGHEVYLLTLAAENSRVSASPDATTMVAVWIDPVQMSRLIAESIDPNLHIGVTCHQASTLSKPSPDLREQFPRERAWSVPFGDSVFTLRITSRPEFWRSDTSSLFVLVTGLVVTGLLASVIGSLHVMQRRAVRLAETMTSELRESQKRLRHDSLHDALTGLPNRAFFRHRLAERLEKAREKADHNFAVLFLDLDRFKVINDSLGHAAGDELLRAVSRRLERGLRGCRRSLEADHGDTIARMGGDEFTVLLDHVESGADAFAIAERIQTELSAPYHVLDHEVFTSASVGIRLGDDECREPEDVLRDADTAMYQAKACGKARHEAFNAAMRLRAGRRLKIENELRRAVESGNIDVAFQPIVTADRTTVVGFEALARWHHEDGRDIPPADFIPLAEDLGIINVIGDLVLSKSCETLQYWRDALGRSDLRMSVNVSRRQIAQPGLEDRVIRIIESFNIKPSQIILEITESVVMDDPDAAGSVMQRLRDHGVEFWMDDFGTGYSSLSCLHRLPVDGLKIDRSFIGCLSGSRDDVSIISAIITLAHNLGIGVTAEGVETELQLAQLRDMDCDRVQGYFIARPIPFDLATQFIRNPTAIAAHSA